MPTLIVCILRLSIPDSDEYSLDAAQFKQAFEEAQKNNLKLAGTANATSLAEDKSEETVESKDEDEDEDEEEADAPAPGETNPPVAGEGEKAEEE